MKSKYKEEDTVSDEEILNELPQSWDEISKQRYLRGYHGLWVGLMTEREKFNQWKEMFVKEGEYDDYSSP